jgi:CRP/FNR family transcriptional regulator
MVCVVDGHKLRAHMTDKPEISIQIINELTNRLSDTENKLEQHNLTSVEKRMAVSIIELSNGKSSFILPISKLDWASMLGTTSETLSRRLRDLKDKGIIELKGQRGIEIINLNKLHEI